MEVQTRSPLNVHIYHMHIFMNSWKVNEVICIPQKNRTFSKMCPHKIILKMHELGTTLGILGKCHISYLFYLISTNCIPHKQVMFHNYHMMFYRYAHGYGLDNHCKNPNHRRSMKCSCLATFSIKWLYIWLEVVELSFYHHAHTQINGEPTHG